MPASDDELTWARSYIGNVETDDTFNERVDRLEADFNEREQVLNAAVEESMRGQLNALMLDQPSQASVGSISYSNAANIQELSKELEKFQTHFGVGMGSLQTARLVRPRER